MQSNKLINLMNWIYQTVPSIG